MHASIDMSALQLGKHVYGQKPLAHDLYEVRKLTEFVRGGNLVTKWAFKSVGESLSAGASFGAGRRHRKD